MKHSPAPFSVNGFNNIIDANRKTIAHITEFVNDPISQNEANAVLLAAAPELLAVLEDVIYALSDTDGEGLIEYTHWMVKARAVIAKAKGE